MLSSSHSSSFSSFGDIDHFLCVRLSVSAFSFSSTIALMDAVLLLSFIEGVCISYEPIDDNFSIH